MAIAKPKGWRGESGRHSAAARGIPTTKPKRGKKRFAITLLRVPSLADPDYWMDVETPLERKEVVVEAKHMDAAAKKAEKGASDEDERWVHARIRELT